MTPIVKFLCILLLVSAGVLYSNLFSVGQYLLVLAIIALTIWRTSRNLNRKHAREKASQEIASNQLMAMFYDLLTKSRELEDKLSQAEARLIVSQAANHNLKNGFLGIKMFTTHEVASGGLRDLITQIKSYTEQYIRYANENLVGKTKLNITKFSVIDLIKEIKANKNILGQNFEIKKLDNVEDLKIINNFQSNKELLRLVVNELIDNALEADPKSVVIKISILKEGWLKIEITNQGHIKNTESFLNQPGQPHGDHTGLGSYLVGKIVTNTLGGYIELEKNDNQQVKITIKVPHQ